MQDGPKTMDWIKDIKELFIRDPDFWLNARKTYYTNLDPN